MVRSAGSVGGLGVAHRWRRSRSRRSPRPRSTATTGARPRRRRPGHLGEPLVGHERLGLRVLQDVGDLGTDQVVVDRDQVPAGLQGGQVELEHLHPVGEEGGDHVPGLEAEAAQPVDHLVGPAEELAGACTRSRPGSTRASLSGFSWASAQNPKSPMVLSYPLPPQRRLLAGCRPARSRRARCTTPGWRRPGGDARTGSRIWSTSAGASGRHAGSLPRRCVSSEEHHRRSDDADRSQEAERQWAMSGFPEGQGRGHHRCRWWDRSGRGTGRRGRGGQGGGGRHRRLAGRRGPDQRGGRGVGRRDRGRRGRGGGRGRERDHPGRRREDHRRRRRAVGSDRRGGGGGRHPAGADALQHVRGRVGRGHRDPPEGSLHRVPGRLGHHAQAGGRRLAGGLHLGGLRRQRGPGQLRGGQGRHRLAGPFGGRRAQPLRHHRQRRRPGGPHPDVGQRPHGPGRDGRSRGRRAAGRLPAVRPGQARHRPGVHVGGPEDRGVEPAPGGAGHVRRRDGGPPRRSPPGWTRPWARSGCRCSTSSRPTGRPPRPRRPRQARARDPAARVRCRRARRTRCPRGRPGRPSPRGRSGRPRPGWPRGSRAAPPRAPGRRDAGRGGSGS